MFKMLKRVSVAGSIAALALSGCMVVPVGPDGSPIYPPSGAVAYATVPVTAVPYRAPAYGAPPTYAAAVAAPAAPVPSVLQARLYPSNEIASRTGMLSGTVTNMMTGKGQFQLDLAGEMLSGEATRVPGNDRAGIASAYGARGTFMNCEYKMTTPYQGTGSCHVSNGAEYQVHIGA
jgi:hypothetical protein